MFEADRRDYTAAHALLRTTLSLYDGRPPQDWSFDSSASGKPFIHADSGHRGRLLFNLTHTHGLVACAVTSGADVGVDAVRIDEAPNVEQLSERWCSATELAELGRCRGTDRPTRFMELWALKEAFAKAIGVGLSLHGADMSFDLSQPRTIRFTPPTGYGGADWRCALFALGSRYRLALVVRGAADCPLEVSARPAVGRSHELAVLIATSW